MTKKIFIIIAVSVLFLTFYAPLYSLKWEGNSVFAQEQEQSRKLEVDYPAVGGTQEPEEVTTEVSKYVKYIYNFIIWISGFIALGVLINAGFQWFTSAGSPEKIKEARDRIGAALLGLLILFGSYLILITINPDLITFNLPQLRPIISKVPRGILLCKEEVEEIGRAMQLENNFKYTQEYWEQKEIKEELDNILDEIARACYSVAGAGDIRSDFNNQITDIYFIPGDQIIDGERYIADYGAVFYEDTNYEGKSQPIYEHLKPGELGGMMEPVHKKPEEINPSSIKPFVLIPQHHEEKFQVVLYQEYNRNTGFPELEGRGYNLNPGSWYGVIDITENFCLDPGSHGGTTFCSPRSIKVGGPFIAILLTPDGRSDTFYNVIDNNLDDNLNIINWVKCKSYDSKNQEGLILKKCAQPAVNQLIIISANIY